MFQPTKPLGMAEFVLLLAFMISILALSTDAMLPAMAQIGFELGVSDPNKTQLVLSSMFLGFGVGQIIAGPLSDSYGRKPVIFTGYVIFIVGCLISMLTTSFEWMLVGRVLQGLGASAPRIVGVALVRDGYEGRTMARIMSIVMAIFIIVPAIAPAIGQGIIWVADWRMIFGMLLGVSLIAFFWVALRQPETLAKDCRRDFTFSELLAGIREAFSYRALTGYTIASGFIFGAFVGYLSTAQQVFQFAYDTGDMFAIYFGVAALSIGAASVFNSALVERLGMRYLAWRAILLLTTISSLFLILVVLENGLPAFIWFMIWLLLTFFCIGMLFGNFNAMAMEPVGHMAGLGAAVSGAVSTLISLPLGWAIGVLFDGTVISLVGGFALFGALTALSMYWTERTKVRIG